MRTPSKSSVARRLTIVVVVAFLAVLGWYLGQGGYSPMRLALLVALGGVAVAGAVGVVYERAFITAGSVCALFVLGFWQAALWVYIFPVGGVLFGAAIVVAGDAGPDKE